MKVGIIIHSHTGNTLSVAEKLRNSLEAAGHSVTLERVTAVNEAPSPRGPVQLKSTPELSDYEALIFGAPVWAFGLNPVMKEYLAQLSSVQGKKVCGFVTQAFPYPWMGGNRAIKQMTECCKEKGVQLQAAGIVNWGSKKREKMIEDIVVKMGSL